MSFLFPVTILEEYSYVGNHQELCQLLGNLSRFGSLSYLVLRTCAFLLVILFEHRLLILLVDPVDRFTEFRSVKLQNL